MCLTQQKNPNKQTKEGREPRNGLAWIELIYFFITQTSEEDKKHSLNTSWVKLDFVFYRDWLFKDLLDITDYDWTLVYWRILTF